MRKTTVWMLDSFRRNGILSTLKYISNTAFLYYAKTMRKQRWIKCRIHGNQMWLDTEDPGVSRTLIIKGTREKDQVEVVKTELKSGMVVLDIGANIGSYALLEASLVGEAGKVFALEPSPENFDLLRRNIALNGLENVIESHCIGASNRTGVGHFYQHAASNLHTFHPQKYQQFKNEKDDYQSVLEVNVVNIYEFVQDRPNIDFIRMDVEGFEVEILDGLIPGIEEGLLSPKILFECHRPKYDDLHHSMRVQLERLFALGYMPKVLISTDESIARFGAKGYLPQKTISTDGVRRGLYYGISAEDAIALICDIGFVRAALLVKG